MEKILLVDDEPDILEFLKYNLTKEGYLVSTASNGKDAIVLATEILPNLIILDVMMPGIDGIETCKELRKIASLDKTIIIFLTARDGDYTQIAGLEAGADDYISKPIKPKVLVSKIRSLMRRSGNVQTESTDSKKEVFGNMIIDKERYLVICDGEEIILPKKEFELLLLLSSKPNKVFTREEIYAGIWGDSVIVGDRTIDVHIRKLREKIGEEYVSTVKGVGYRFEY